MSSPTFLASASTFIAGLLLALLGAVAAPAATTAMGSAETTTAVIEFAEGARTVPEHTQYPYPPLMVTRTGDTTGPATVGYAPSGGTATPQAFAGSPVPEADYRLDPGTLYFAAGETSQAIPLQIYPDSVFEADETVVVTLSSPGEGATLGARSSLTVTITDDDAPRLQFNNVIYNGSETGGSAMITVTRTHDPAVPVEVDYSTSDGSAVAGVDYTATSGTLSFAPGQTSRSFTVPILADDIVENSEVVKLQLSTPTGGAQLGAPKSALLYISDTDHAVVQFQQTTHTVAENVGVALLTVIRSGNTAASATVSYAVASGTATPGSDFSLTPGTLTFAAEETTKTIQVTITDDSASEAAETIDVELHLPGDATMLGTQTSTKLTIAASDQKPDILVSTAKATGYVGNDVYNTTGAGQTRKLRAQRSQTRTFYLRVQNDGHERNIITIRGTAAVAGSTVRYMSGTTDVTALMRSADGWKVRLRPGAYKPVKVLIRVLAGASLRSEKSAMVSGTWTGDDVRVDVVKTAVTVVS